MRRNLAKGIILVCLAAVLGMGGEAGAAGFGYGAFKGEWGLRFGYGKSVRKADVKLYSLLPRWGIFVVRPGNNYLGKVGIAFVLEGIISIAGAEKTGFELGITPMMKITYPLAPGVIFFLEGGAGIISESIDSPVIAHTFNFTPQCGGGLDIALTPRLGATLAYRFRHSSSAGIYKDNPAFNTNFFHLGLTYYY